MDEWRRATEAIIDLGAIAANARRLRPSTSQLCAVVKADGYGHGAVRVAQAALQGGASSLAVALVEEGIALRRGGIEAPILLLNELPAGSADVAVSHRLTPSFDTRAGIEELRRLPRSKARTICAHLKVDTDMLSGGAVASETLKLAMYARSSGVRIGGVWTHLSSANKPSNPAPRVQLRRYRAALKELQIAGLRTGLRHAANTAARLTLPDSTFDMVRIGVGLYGLSPLGAHGRQYGLVPALTLRSRVSYVQRVASGESVSYGHWQLTRDSNIAVVPIGYADGYPRALSGRGSVLIRGSRHPIAGAVTMDQLMIDCGDCPVQREDEVILIGTQGKETITIEDMANLIGTVPHEIVAGIAPRVRRVEAAAD